MTIHKEITRTHLIDGKNVVADQRTVTVNVDQTKDLHDRQVIEVTWSGAHPTANQAPDPTSIAGADQEYPFVLLECRGVDSASAPAAKQLSPETCWTQTPTERYLPSPSLAFPPWRVDRYANPADRNATVGVPKPLPSSCYLSGSPEYWLHLIGANGVDYPGGPRGGCAGMAPEQSTVGSTTSLPSNTTYGVTGSDGTGQSKFVVWTSLTNSTLGCGPSVPCSLVAVPIEGISCDVAAARLPPRDQPKGQDASDAENACTSTGGGSVPAETVAGKLWWSASNWRNRVTIPLGFAPLPVLSCTQGSNSGVQIYGSELMTAVTSQWDSHFCESSSLFPVTHIQTGETQARNLVSTGNSDAAYTSFGPDTGYSSPVVSAPVAMTGFSIGFAIDDAHQHEYLHLRLTPRLLAKLLTESYPAVRAVKDGYSALSNNPLNIGADPEFQALNPGISHDVANSYGASTLLMLSSESDVVRALTAYINADAEARAWLDGAPDPWGMVVNPNYRGIKLPVDSWPLLDTYEPQSLYNEGNVCLQQNPVPFLPLVASPTTRLNLISLNLQYAIQQSQVVCTGAATQNPKLSATGPEINGYRFIIGITSMADAARYRIDQASLQTRVSQGAPTKFTDDTGRTFVAPSDASLRAAAGLLTPNKKSGVWVLPYGDVAGPSASTTAYPGAMLISAAIPTKGLPQTESQDYATFLDFAAGDGQTPGGGTGELPAGYLPLTSANGLGLEIQYTRVAAQYIRAQNGQVPSLTSPQPLPTSTPTPSSSPGTSTAPAHSGHGKRPTGPGAGIPAGSGQSPGPAASQAVPVGGGVNPPPGAASSSPAPATAGRPSATPAGSGAPSATTTLVPTAATPRISTGWMGVLLPALALVGLAAGLVVSAMTRLGRRRR